MKKCPFCAADIQDAALICRFCDRDLRPATAPVQVTRKRRVPTFAWWGLVVVALVVIVGGAMGPGLLREMRSREPQDADELRVGGSYLAPNLHLINEDSRHWDRVELLINDRFHCEAGDIDRGTSKDIDLRGCVADGGEIFNVFTTAPRRMVIEARIGPEEARARGSILMRPVSQ